MARFRVRFMKSIPNSSGHLQACLQRSIDVEAADSDAALTNAQQAFCTLMRISECRFYADAFEIETLPEAPQLSRPG